MTTTHVLTPVHPDPVLPAHYHSLMSSTDKYRHAQDMADLAISRGLTPVAASVTGSRLRGLDHPASDVDGLVLVAEKLTRARSWTYRSAHGDSLEVSTSTDDPVQLQVQSLEGFVARLSRSVPYVEFLHSPFLLVDPRLRAYLASLRINRYELQIHARGFAAHALARASDDPGAGQTRAKATRNALVAQHVSATLSPLMPRTLLSDGVSPSQAAALTSWLEQH